MDANKLGCRANQAVIKGLDERITALDTEKQDVLTFDTTPTDGSTNPVTSDGIYDALGGKQDALTFDTTPTQDSVNPVTSGGVYTALQSAGGNKTWVVSVTDDYDAFVDTNGRFAQDFMVEVKNTLNYIEMDSFVMFRKGMMLSDYGTVVDSRQLQASENSMTVASMDITVKQVIVSPHDKLGCEYYRHDGEVRIETDPVSGDAYVTYEAHLSDPDDYEPTELTFTSGSLDATKFRIWVLE